MANRGLSGKYFVFPCVLFLLLFVCCAIYVSLYILGVKIPIHSNMHSNFNARLTSDIRGRPWLNGYSKYKDDGKDQFLVTLFTTWTFKTEKRIVNENTLMNWNSLSRQVRPVLFINTYDTVIHTVNTKGWDILPIPQSARGIPVLKHLFLTVMKKYNSHFYCYANGDILFTDSLMKTLHGIINSSLPLSKPILITGRRTNVRNVTRKEASSWKTLHDISKSRGSLFASYAEDYFITTSNYPWEDIPNLVVGRIGVDNWLVLNNRIHNYTTIDASSTLLAIHQTTEFGNYESHKSKHSLYNRQLLAKLYKNINYLGGYTSCAENYTTFKNSSIVICGRKTGGDCRSFFH